MSDGPECFIENWTPEVELRVKRMRIEDYIERLELEKVRTKENYDRILQNLDNALMSERNKLSALLEEKS